MELEDFHHTEYWYKKVLEAERREVQYWKVRISQRCDNVVNSDTAIGRVRERDVCATGNDVTCCPFPSNPLL